MRVIQLTPTLVYGDAVSNDALAIEAILKKRGYDTGIYVEIVDGRLPEGTVTHRRKMPRLKKEDVLIYHASNGTELNELLPTFGGRKVVRYHNVTPPEFFRGYSFQLEKLTEYGRKGIRGLAGKVDYAICDSSYNRQDLENYGYTCPMDVCPILIPFSDYDKTPDEGVLKRYRGDGYTNLLFVGRIAPNKKQEDVIRAFKAYRQQYNPKSRLFLVGSCLGMETYCERLKRYAERLGVGDGVIFPGHIRFAEILAYYRLADVFLCMSEHEGFCVPLVEAMHFGTPIVAYGAAAVPETLSDAGILLDSKSPELAAAVIDRVVRDEGLRAHLRERQAKRLATFAHDTVAERFMQSLDRVTGGAQ